MSEESEETHGQFLAKAFARYLSEYMAIRNPSLCENDEVVPRLETARKELAEAIDESLGGIIESIPQDINDLV